MSTIAEKVKAKVSEHLDVEVGQLSDDKKFIEDLNADSLAIVELVLAFEEEFDIEIPDEHTEQIATVGDAIRYIETATAAKGGAEA